MKEQHFRVGVQHLKAMIDSEQAGQHYSALAEACLCALLPVVAGDFAGRHGPMPGQGAMVLGMGSLGAGSLTATSDLDLIVIYDAKGEEASIGKRPLAVSTYYARLTQALVTALTSPMSDGRLYEVDMRLRPSGRKGPVATPLNGFVSYQQTEAWTWEHLALTRARPVAGQADLCAEIEAFRSQVIAATRDPAKVLRDVSDMRARLAEAADKARIASIWETKLGPGRMLDIELLAQAACLTAGSAVRRVEDQLGLGIGLGWYDAAGCDGLIRGYQRLRRIQQIGRLLVEGQLTPATLGQGGCALLLQETGAASIDALQARLVADHAALAALIDALLGRPAA